MAARCGSFVKRPVSKKTAKRFSTLKLASLREQLPAWIDALWQAALESNAERRARFVAARLDEVADGLQWAQVAEDDDERHEEIIPAQQALLEAGGRCSSGAESASRRTKAFDLASAGPAP